MGQGQRDTAGKGSISHDEPTKLKTDVLGYSSLLGSIINFHAWTNYLAPLFLPFPNFPRTFLSQ